MFDEYLNPPPCVDLQVPTVIAPYALSTSTSQTNQETPSLVIPLGVEEANHDIKVAHMDNNPYVDFPITELSSEESSTRVQRHLLNQSKYALESHKKYGMETCDPVDTPMVEKSKLDEDPQGKVVDPTRYRGMIGTLMYLTSSRPDLVFVVCMCARYQAKPIKKHLLAVKLIFRYLRGTINTGLWYSKDSCIALTTFVDADHAGFQDTIKSTSGSMQLLGDRLVSWSSKKQKSTTISSTKAKYIALSRCLPLLYVVTTSNTPDPSILTLDITLSRSKWRTGWLSCILSE
ncbi:hypothetical protein Tco_1202104 [Tanacetum coccineum]